MYKMQQCVDKLTAGHHYLFASLLPQTGECIIAIDILKSGLQLKYPHPIISPSSVLSKNLPRYLWVMSFATAEQSLWMGLRNFSLIKLMMTLTMCL